MNKIILFTLLLLVKTSATYSQNVKSTVNLLKDTILVDEYFDIQYYKNGNIKSKGQIRLYRYNEKYDVETPVGEWFYFYKNGKTKRYIKSNEFGVPIETEIEYFKNGSVKNETIWCLSDTSCAHNYTQRINKVVVFGKSYYSKFYRNDGSLWFEGAYKNNNGISIGRFEDGIWIYYDKNGAIEYEVVYDHGKKLSTTKY